MQCVGSTVKGFISEGVVPVRIALATVHRHGPLRQPPRAYVFRPHVAMPREAETLRLPYSWWVFSLL